MHTAVSVQPVASGEDVVRSFGILSTFPPTSCGIATFSAALAAGLIAHGASVDVVRCSPSPELEDALVLACLNEGSRSSLAAAIDVLNATDVAIIQHEYGLYDGPDGNSILTLMATVVVPIVVVAHTVVSAPTPGQRFVLEGVCHLADVVVVMTDTARARLVAGFAVGPSKVIEWAIDAMAELDDLRPPPNYVVAGATHPKERESSGEAYREMLVDRASRSTSGSWVSFDDAFGRPGGAAVRFPGSGDFGRARGRGGAWTTCGIDGVPARGRTACQRRRHHRSLARSGGAWGRDAFGADRSRSRLVHGR
ncbi:MAG: hypothetical protein JJD93_08760 [Ilumatobacteraceae bacterium]|nr:hypothetical protein [Ilumatobacteraceae bacterium]